MNTALAGARKTPTDSLLAALSATRLLGRWSLVCQRHDGGGCSCCPGLGDINMAEVERLLCKDLRTRHALLADRDGFVEVLRLCVARNFAAEQEDLSALLEDIGRAINELERVQNGLY
jgi:hypothetical protein